MSRGQRYPRATDDELMAKARFLYRSIHVDKRFGPTEVFRYEATVKKLEERGYRVKTTLAFEKME